MKADKITFSDFKRWVGSLIRKIDKVDEPLLKGYPFDSVIKEYLKEFPYDEDTPLTEETLEELGFEKIDFEPYNGKGNNWWEFYLWLEPDPGYLYLKLRTDLSNNKTRYCTLELGKEQCQYRRPIFKTVGEVKMLLMALKGDE